MGKRAVVILGSVLAVTVLMAQAQKKVVFVCEHGAAKSIIAAAEFNRLAEEKRLPYRAISRGTHPDPEFAAGVVTGLKKDGFSVPAGKPQLLSATDVKGSQRVVTLGCKLPDALSAGVKTEDWADISSPSKDYNAARADIGRHVRQLIDELAAGAK